ncbi:MAG: leucine-rich repeat domain-containing protein, partial [Cytophagales bacterium]|nr:leucine-rich repeat domain-containing protein [Cytophagales bacterium]
MGAKKYILKACKSLLGKSSIAALLLCFSISQSFSQSYTLPDTNFRNKLLVSYPFLMTGNQLNLAVATAYPGSLLLSNSNISDLTGIEYFGKIYFLDVSQNQLSTLPGLSNLKQLSALWVGKNKLTAIPTLTALSNLTDLTFNDNQVTQFPDISGLSGIKIIYGARNKLKVLPNLTPLASTLNYLHVSENQLDSLPDLSIFSKLAQLHCDNNHLKEIRGLASLGNLQVLYCWNNAIKDLSGLANNTALGIFYCYGNQLTSLPNLNNKPLTMINVSKNQLTFSDILPIHVSTTVSNWEYGSQDSVGTSSQVFLNEGQTLSL